MNPQDKERVFISWTGELGKKIAEYLKREMLNYAQLEPWLSGDITLGSTWFRETQAALESAKYGVVCLTPGSSKRPWINFEVGFMFGRLGNCKLITFGETLINPLDQLQKMNGLEQENWVKLLDEMTTDRSQDECRAWVRDKFPELRKIIEYRNLSPYKYLTEMDQEISEIQRVVDELKDSSYARENTCLQRVILDSYQEMQNRLAKNSIYIASASRYPQHLISLQQNLNAVVKAVALVDIEEEFWQQTQGLEILRTANERNSRIFVFATEKQFMKMSQTLQNHANHYHVYVMSYSQLSKEFNLYAKDFSIIDTPGGKLLADYDTAQGQKIVCFNADLALISKHESAFESIVRNAIPLQKKRMNGEELEALRYRIFHPYRLINYETKTIEMSLYIDIENYNEHEENHAYYCKMMERMIQIFSQHFPLESQPYRVLELGAGTGIFTSRLVDQDSINEVVAIEIDWHCYKKLEYRFRNQKNRVKTLHEDSRTFDPEGKFDCIFSSFADHHIKEGDKQQYFDNVRRNLKPGGLLIVGDEFLREHDSTNEVERRQALEAYHNHIIEKAREDKDEILVQLESRALQSGLEKLGDFKVSCKVYEELLIQAGFVIQERELIGPETLSSEIGGIYVYTIRNA